MFDRFGYVGGDLLRKFKGNRSWSEYYIQDLRKIPFKPVMFLKEGSRKGRLDQVIITLKNGADIHVGNDLSLRAASGYGHLEVVKYLVGEGC